MRFRLYPTPEQEQKLLWHCSHARFVYSFKCGYISEENRKNQATFRCVKCGYANNADVNAAMNIAAGSVDKLTET